MSHAYKICNKVWKKATMSYILCPSLLLWAVQNVKKPFCFMKLQGNNSLKLLHEATQGMSIFLSLSTTFTAFSNAWRRQARFFIAEISSSFCRYSKGTLFSFETRLLFKTNQSSFVRPINVRTITINNFNRLF